jgi:RimJ/RimL family protein N-acetyltransferase
VARAFAFRTRDGRSGVVREARATDAKAALAIVAEATHERPRTLAVIERELWGPRQWRKHRLGWGKVGVSLVAEVDGAVVGQLTVSRGTRPTTTHRAEFGITVASGARGQGVGRALLEVLETWAREYGVDRIELGVFEGNDRARGLYTAMGYAQEGVETAGVRFPEQDVDVVRMYKLLSPRTTMDAASKARMEGDHDG